MSRFYLAVVLAMLAVPVSAYFDKVGDGYCRDSTGRTYPEEFSKTGSVTQDMCKLQCALFSECVAIEYTEAEQRCALVGSKLNTQGSLAGAIASGQIKDFVRQPGTSTNDEITKFQAARGIVCTRKTGGKEGACHMPNDNVPTVALSERPN